MLWKLKMKLQWQKRGFGQGCIHQKYWNKTSTKVQRLWTQFWNALFNLSSKAAYLSAHEDVDKGVVGSTGLGKEWRDNGHCWGDHALPAKGLHHGHDGVRRPTQQEAGYHEEKHHSHLLLIAQDLDDLNCLEVLDGAQLQERRERDSLLEATPVHVHMFILHLTSPKECYNGLWPPGEELPFICVFLCLKKFEGASCLFEYNFAF